MAAAAPPARRPGNQAGLLPPATAEHSTTARFSGIPDNHRRRYPAQQFQRDRWRRSAPGTARLQNPAAAIPGIPFRPPSGYAALTN
jgi:hypothetical protein